MSRTHPHEDSQSPELSEEEEGEDEPELADDEEQNGEDEDEEEEEGEEDGGKSPVIALTQSPTALPIDS